jgi:hypothetical protein
MNDAVKAAWDDTVAHWDDPAKHTAFLGAVAQHDGFAWAAARYKERAGDPIADRQLEKLRTAAVAAMLAKAPRAKDSDTPYRSTLIMLAALLLILVLGLVFVTILHGNAH